MMMNLRSLFSELEIAKTVDQERNIPGQQSTQHISSGQVMTYYAINSIELVRSRRMAKAVGACIVALTILNIVIGVHELLSILPQGSSDQVQTGMIGRDTEPNISSEQAIGALKTLLMIMGEIRFQPTRGTTVMICITAMVSYAQVRLTLVVRKPEINQVSVSLWWQTVPTDEANFFWWKSIRQVAAASTVLGNIITILIIFQVNHIMQMLVSIIFLGVSQTFMIDWILYVEGISVNYTT